MFRLVLMGLLVRLGPRISFWLILESFLVLICLGRLICRLVLVLVAEHLTTFLILKQKKGRKEGKKECCVLVFIPGRCVKNLPLVEDILSATC